MGKRKYKRLHYEDRQTIEAMSKQGSSVSDIAEALGTHRDTIYREFKRCNATLKTYTAKVREFLAKYTDELPDTDELDGDSTTGNVEEHRTQER